MSTETTIAPQAAKTAEKVLLGRQAPPVTLVIFGPCGDLTKPLVVRLDGNNVEEGRRILQERNHPLVTIEPTMDGAARRAAELASQA